jgi:hypothetical protein
MNRTCERELNILYFADFWGVRAASSSSINGGLFGAPLGNAHYMSVMRNCSVRVLNCKKSPIIFANTERKRKYYFHAKTACSKGTIAIVRALNFRNFL